MVGLADKRSIWTEDLKGPSALTRRQLYYVAEGFVRGKGLTVEDITFRLEIKGEEYVYVTKEECRPPSRGNHPSSNRSSASFDLPVSMGQQHSLNYICSTGLDCALDEQVFDLDF